VSPVIAAGNRIRRNDAAPTGGGPRTAIPHPGEDHRHRFPSSGQTLLRRAPSARPIFDQVETFVVIPAKAGIQGCRTSRGQHVEAHVVLKVQPVRRCQRRSRRHGSARRFGFGHCRPRRRRWRSCWRFCLGSAPRRRRSTMATTSALTSENPAGFAPRAPRVELPAVPILKAPGKADGVFGVCACRNE